MSGRGGAGTPKTIWQRAGVHRGETELEASAAAAARLPAPPPSHHRARRRPSPPRVQVQHKQRLAQLDAIRAAIAALERHAPAAESRTLVEQYGAYLSAASAGALGAVYGGARAFARVVAGRDAVGVPRARDPRVEAHRPRLRAARPRLRELGGPEGRGARRVGQGGDELQGRRRPTSSSPSTPRTSASSPSPTSSSRTCCRAPSSTRSSCSSRRTTRRASRPARSRRRRRETG